MIKILFGLLAISITASSQTINDFRGLTWGMSIEEVKKTEIAPLTKEEKNLIGIKNGQEYYDGLLLLYENVTVGGKKADIYYEFKNGKLTKLRVVYTTTLAGNEGEMSQRINSFSDLFNTLSKKQFRITDPIQCGDHAYSGPDYKNPDNQKIADMNDRNIDNEKLALVDKMVSEKNYKSVFLRIESERSRGLINFYTKYSDMVDIAPTVFELTPSFQIEKKIKESDF
jgi:hypothetical protein